MTRNAKTALAALALFAAMTAVLAFVPVGFVGRAPGRVADLLGTASGGSAIEVAGVSSYPAAGSLLLSTVAQTGADSPLTFAQALIYFFLPDHDVRLWSRVYESGATSAQTAAQDQAAMAASQQTAVVAALRAAGLPVSEFPRVVAVSSSAAAAGRLRPGDVVTSVNGVVVHSVAEAVAEVRRNAVGAVVPLIVQRPGVSWPIEEQVRLGSLASDPETAALGVTWEQSYSYGAEVAFRIDPGIGGGSAGLALGLAVYDLLTPGDLTGGRTVAAVGALSLIEPANYRIAEVGRTSAIREKLAAAEAQGAEIFLLPQDNCSDLPPSQSPNVRIIPVASFHAAVEILTDLQTKGDAARVPR
ncbi:MAG: PDZ domain-containing protein, partial [Propionibacteriaceae bacterium]|nr:PDZ domain-containing protein [Propionibacteriaceae bacterium]